MALMRFLAGRFGLTVADLRAEHDVPPSIKALVKGNEVNDDHFPLEGVPVCFHYIIEGDEDSNG